MIAWLYSQGASSQAFDWSARDDQGRLQTGRSQAGGENQLRAQLRRRGLQALELRPVKLGRAKSVSTRELAQLTRQLAALLRAGLPLLQSLQIVARAQSHPGIVQRVEQVHADLQNGMALAAALRRQAPVFNDLYIALVEAGEASGRLDLLLERLALHLDKTEALARRVRTALLYPLVVLTVAVAVMAVIMVVVVPAFENVFASFGAQLPWATQWVIGSSRWLVQWGPWLLLAVAGLAAAMVPLWRRNPDFARRLDDALLATPVWGRLLQQAAVARWSRTLATLLAAGLPLAEALQSVRGACGHLAHAQATARVREEVLRGSSLRAALMQSALFPPMLQQMCAIGEESGTLDHLLEKVADFQEADLDEQLGHLSGLLEPATIVLLGLIVGALVLALYLPVFQMGQIV